MNLRKFFIIIAAIAAAIALAAVSVFAIVAGVVVAGAVRLAFWANKPKGDDGSDDDGMIDITSQGRVL